MSDIENEPSCKSCGVPWVDHMGIMGICAENAKLRKERDAARAEEEIKRLRAELKTALDERDDARRMYCIVRMRISNKPEPTDTSQSLGWEGLWQGRPHSNSETRKKTK